MFSLFLTTCIAAETDEQHEHTLRKVFRRAREKNVRFNRNKIQLRMQQCKYIGHLLTSEGIRADPNKVKAISDIGSPTDAQDCIVSYLSQFVLHLADLTAPLRQLMHS